MKFSSKDRIKKLVDEILDLSDLKTRRRLIGILEGILYMLRNKKISN